MIRTTPPLPLVAPPFGRCSPLRRLPEFAAVSERVDALFEITDGVRGLRAQA